MRKFKLFLTAGAFLLTCIAAIAQTSVKGTVTSSEDGQPVIGATVYVEGTLLGTVTGQDGKYVITGIPASAKSNAIIVSCIGYKDASYPQQAVVDAVLDVDEMLLDEVVVTALGITKNQKALGYSATTVKGDEIASTRTTNAMESLAGKVAGMQVSGSATTAGGAQSVIIRGVSSIGNSNQPLYVVDGMPLQSSTFYNTAQGYGNLASGIGSINNDDIESVTVLKGAAATALYGSRASGGVIIVNTKNGKDKGRTEVTVNAGVQFESVSYLPEFQNKFGTGWDGSLTLDENGSWGPVLNDQFRVYGPVVDNSQMAKNFTAIPNNVKNFYETGVQYNAGVSLSGSTDKTSYYVSYSNVSDDGILPRDKDTYDKSTLAFRGSHKLNSWIAVESSFNYSNQVTNQVSQGSGQQSILEGLYQAGRDISFIDAQDLTSIFNRPEGWYTPYGITNPYWIIDNSYNKVDIDKIFGKVQVDLQPIRQLTVSYRYGFDRTNYDSKLTMYQIAMDPSYSNSSSTNQEGTVSASYGRTYEVNHDVLANWKDTYVGGNFDVNATLGWNANQRGSTSMNANVQGLTFDTGFWDLSNTSNQPSASESQSLRRSVSVFADATFGWKDQYYLDVTARNDWSSTLPVGNRSFFYPGVTGSWIVTNTFDLASTPLSYMKLRAAYGKTGNDPSVYLTEAVYTQGYATSYIADKDLSFPFNGYNAYMASATLASSSLQPEMTTEFEVGADIRLWGGRLGIDAAYYNRTSDMQIFSLPADPATGYTTMVVNFGKVGNKGVELLLTTVPVRTKNFEWDLDFNFSKNYNEVKSLPDGVQGKSQLVKYDDVITYAEVGKPIGTLWTNLPQYTEDGQIIVGADGLPIQGEYEYTGFSTQNDWTGGISTSLRYKNITIGATLDIRWGGKMYSRTKTLLWFTGNSIENTYNDRRAFVIPNSVVETADADGNPVYVENNVPITLYSSTYQYYMNGNDSYPLEGGLCKLVDRSYAKLRNLSISYDVPAKFTEKIGIKGLKVSAVGNNLFLWTPSSNAYIDPDQGYTTDIRGMFGEINCTVPTRYFGFNVQVKF